MCRRALGGMPAEARPRHPQPRALSPSCSVSPQIIVAKSTTKNQWGKYLGNQSMAISRPGYGACVKALLRAGPGAAATQPTVHDTLSRARPALTKSTTCNEDPHSVEPKC